MRKGWIRYALFGVVLGVLLPLIGPDSAQMGAVAARQIVTDVRIRDPQASSSARAVYTMLAGLENDARAGRPTHTVIGQHDELQNERYNATYGDYPGRKPPGYYYRKPADITGRFPGFLEVDLGPGYQQSSWGVGEPRPYSAAWPSCRPYWGYTNDAVDLAAGVWEGMGSASAPRRDCSDGATVTLPGNGGGPAGIAGMSFHEPYPGSPVKGFTHTLCRNSPAAHDPKWFARVVTPGTAEQHDLLVDLSFLADHLSYLAARDVPVLLRPYHEMNARDCAGGFWWAGQRPELYRKLWQTMYDYLVGTRGLHNLIFVWAPSPWDGKHGTDPWAYYPGSAYVDVVGVDDYSDTPERPFRGEPWTQIWYRGLARYDKPRMMAESFHVPLSAAQPATLTAAPWVIWSVWGSGLTKHNSPSDVQRTYYASAILTGGTSAQGGRFDWGSLHKSSLDR
ncbi:glycoside hydrolase family 26 protein [Actinacidiphila glaucinigra]|uniref:glycoside hydrolase family 26 protein n=1 Tax=Actinacidiphila glaucinigra TaxID=235986 RepID=UPI00366C5D87